MLIVLVLSYPVLVPLKNGAVASVQLSYCDDGNSESSISRRPASPFILPQQSRSIDRSIVR